MATIVLSSRIDRRETAPITLVYGTLLGLPLPDEDGPACVAGASRSLAHNGRAHGR